jgi:hypothetical protein
MDNATAWPTYTQKKPRYPFYNWFAASSDLCERVWKISPAPGFEPRTLQPVASYYTDYAIPAGKCLRLFKISQILCSPDETTASVIPYGKIS